MADYGVITIEQVLSSRAFIAIHKEILTDTDWKSDPLLSMLTSWKNDTLFTLVVKETDAMWNRNASNSDEFIGGETFCMLPVVMAVDYNPSTRVSYISFLWVHPRARGKGYAKMLVNKLLNLDDGLDFMFEPTVFVSYPIPSAEEFWRHMGFQPTKESHIWEFVDRRVD